MSRSVGLAHIIRHDDGTSSGVWGIYTLQSAFQPIFAFNEGKLSIAAFEGLIRPFRDGEPQSPMAFFSTCPAADRLHVEALTRTLHLLNAGACLPQEASIFVNFDPSVFTERSVADNALRDMRLVLHEAGIDPGRVVCEVTEQRSASQDTLHSFVAALRGSGFRIAVDDYGADDSDINILMVSHGASNINFSFLVDERDATAAIQKLHADFFSEVDPEVFERMGE